MVLQRTRPGVAFEGPVAPKRHFAESWSLTSEGMWPWLKTNGAMLG